MKLHIFTAGILVTFLCLATPKITKAQTLPESWLQFRSNWGEQAGANFQSSMTFLYKTPETKYNIILSFNGYYHVIESSSLQLNTAFNIIINNLDNSQAIILNGELRLIESQAYFKISDLRLSRPILNDQDSRIVNELQSYTNNKWYDLDFNQLTAEIWPQYKEQILPLEHFFVSSAYESSESPTPNILFSLNRAKVRQFVNALQQNTTLPIHFQNTLSTLRSHVQNLRYFNWFFLDAENKHLERLRGILKYADTPHLLMIWSYNIHFSENGNHPAIGIPNLSENL